MKYERPVQTRGDRMILLDIYSILGSNAWNRDRCIEIAKILQQSGLPKLEDGRRSWNGNPKDSET